MKIKSLLLGLLLFAGCHKQTPSPQPIKYDTGKMLILQYALTQEADCSQLDLTDETGLYSLGNTGGWGAPNAVLAAVASVFAAGTIRPAPSTSALVPLPSTELMPVPNALPYVQGQNFNLTPALFGLTQTNWQDGIYEITVTVNVFTQYFFQTVGFGIWAVGDIITDSTTGKVIGQIFNIVGGNVILDNLTGWTITATDTVTNGITATTAFAVTGFAGPTTAYTATVQQEICCNDDCCLGNKLAKISWGGCCEGKEIDEVCDNIFMPLMGSKAQAGGGMNNASLDTLNLVAKRCEGCGCGCS